LIRDARARILNNGRCWSEAGGGARASRAESERHVIEDRDPITRSNPRWRHPIEAFVVAVER